MKNSLLLALLLFTTLAISAQTTYTVGHSDDWPGMEFDFGSISYAINAAADGDTILVYPFYVPYHRHGFINFAGKNVYVTSLYKSTGDIQYLHDTIIDGGGVVFKNNETRNAVLDGFTIINGRGENVGPTYNPSLYKEGGGIYIINANPTIINCIIENNSAITRGGGISIQSTGVFVSPYLAGNIIRNNSSNGPGGGICIGATNPYDIQIIFDPVNKNSIYGNSSPNGRDVYSVSASYMSIALDTFTVATDDPYYLNMSTAYSFSCENWVNEQINQDLYVSVQGDDTNEGVTMNRPLKTIKEAMFRIRSNPAARNTIHLAAGVYKASEGQVFPLIIKSDVVLQGAGQGVTIIDIEENTGVIHSLAGASGFKISNITFINNRADYDMVGKMAPILLSGTDNVEILDCNFENNLCGIQTLETGGAVRTEPILFKNLQFVGNFNSVLDLSLENAVFENIKILGNSYLSLGNVVTFAGTPVKINAYQNARGNYVFSNLLIANTTDVGTENGDMAMTIGGNMDVLINNATIAYNQGTRAMTIGQGAVVNVYNSVLANNGSITGAGTLAIGYSLIEGGVLCDVVWGEGNIDLYPNFDWEYAGAADWPYQLMPTSPCVDAGTASVPDYVWPAVDLLGNARVVGETVDMGAYEFNGNSTLYVDFVGSPLTGEVPLTVQFSDVSVGYEATSWQWDFNDDGVIDSTVQNPVFTYYSVGFSTVRLVVNNGEDSHVKPHYICPLPAEITGGTLQGMVTSGGNPLSEVVVYIMGTTLSAVTNEWGIYSIAGVVAGVYNVKATMSGFDDYTYENVVITTGEVTTHHIVMSPVSDSDEVIMPLQTRLVGNYPNPFNPSTSILFNIAKTGLVEIDVYNIKGAMVKKLVNGLYGAGEHRVVWDGCDETGRVAGSGVYFYRLKTSGVVETRKMLLVK